MDAKELYMKLEDDFITEEMTDDWFDHMSEVKEFIYNNFKKRSMGLVCDFTEEINKVFTAVFPTEQVMQEIIDSNVTNAMLFVHHPEIWDIRKDPVFQNMNRDLLQEFKDRNISIFNLHVPLDNFGEYSTSVTLAKAIGLNPKRAFGEYHGALCGVISDVKATVEELKILFEEAVEHEVAVYDYGPGKVTKVAVVAGGGNDITILKEMVELGVNTLITGITALNDHSYSVHEYAKKNKINILGGTHYSTEKFACMAMEGYFSNLGLDVEFIKGEPIKEDMLLTTCK